MQNKKYLFHSGSFLLLLFIFFACKSSNKISKLNIAPLYEIENNELDLTYFVSHLNENSSELNIGLNSNKLLYTKALLDSSVNYYSEFRITYEVYQGLEDDVIIDSASVFKKITDRSYQNTSFKLPLIQGKSYWIKTIITDKVRKFNAYNLIYVNKFDYNSAGYYINNIDTAILSQNKNSYWVNQDTTFLRHKILKNKLLFALPIVVDYKIPNVPYDTKFFEKDVFQKTKHQVISLNENGAFNLPCTSTLVYLKTDSLNTQGCLFLKVNTNYPRFTNINALIKPLQYIMSKTEYENLLNSNNKRIAFEQFWIKEAGNKEQARKAIKAYYTRVTEANKKFTTYKPGWLTDMGMIYIVKGTPETVKRMNNRELWYYRDTNISDAEVFSFGLTNSTIFKYHYTLERLNDYKYSWEKQIKLCREGRL